MLVIKRQIIKNNNPGIKINPIGTIIHETATLNASAKNEYLYFNNANRYASAHAFVDYNEIIQCIDWNCMAWHAGPTANSKYIGIEMCHFEDQETFNKIYKNTIRLLTHLFINVLKINKVTIDNLISHADASNRWKETDHQDPISYLAIFGKTMDDIRKDVQKMINDYNMSCDEIIKMVSSSPEKWETGINTAVAAAQANGDLGALEIFTHLKLLIEKIHKNAFNLATL